VLARDVTFHVLQQIPFFLSVSPIFIRLFIIFLSIFLGRYAKEGEGTSFKVELPLS
jgi:hypothetical protein